MVVGAVGGEVVALIFSDYLKIFGTDLSTESALMSEKRAAGCS